jgi:ubiquinone/menaquinone biosynthesis C-methylase UbiE
MNSDTVHGSFPVSLQEQELLAAVKIKPGLKVLNLGTGSVFRTLELAQRLGPQSTVHAVLPDRELPDFYNESIRKLGLFNIELLQRTGEELPYADRFFDLVILHCSYRDMGHFNTTVREAARVSGSSAQFLLCILLKDSLQEYFSLIQEALRRRSLTSETDAWNTLKASRARSLKDVETILKNAGLAISEIVFRKYSMSFLSCRSFLNHQFARNELIPDWEMFLNGSDQSEFSLQLESCFKNNSGINKPFTIHMPFAVLECTPVSCA